MLKRFANTEAGGQKSVSMSRFLKLTVLLLYTVKVKENAREDFFEDL